VTPNEPLLRWEWILDHADEIWQRLLEHVTLTVLAVGIGFALSFVAVVLIRRYHYLREPLTWLTGVLYTIPSLALFAVLVPVTGLTRVTAEIGLVSYTLLILIRSILDGLLSVPAEVRETAIGMGCTSGQLLWRVEIPLAVPVVIGGLRVATVTTIGLVTVTALIGQGGFGYFILLGMQRFFSTALIVGATLSILLAILADGLLVLAQHWTTPWTWERRRQA
jgi:osmoprotectant transport system permease protein